MQYRFVDCVCLVTSYVGYVSSSIGYESNPIGSVCTYCKVDQILHRWNINPQYSSLVKFWTLLFFSLRHYVKFGYNLLKSNTRTTIPLNLRRVPLALCVFKCINTSGS